ncbi:MAG: flagellar basal body L-ring protein FlgH [Gammaproteobacteria bacterium]|nr:MAG: flagellar basal body L-ring protein FlgH [Gammaproteobacteria bacterium]
MSNDRTLTMEGMPMNSMRTRAATLMLLAFAVGCSPVIGQRPGEFPPAMPSEPTPPPAGSGAIYRPTTSIALFEDVKARRVGDTLTIKLAERTQASKSASTDATKETSTDTGSPVLLGDTVTRNGDNILNNQWETTQDFEGRGSSSQSNRLDGNITVTVADVLPNGNLVVRGEKWLTLNQGEEYVQISGIVRPTDIGPDNSVPSFKVADARITYSGTGFLNDANRPGLLARFFMKLWPM